ncbi:17-beta-hydroxysteroid dehydrogenase 14-like [Anneissia japonica]|uniref:17-beta-hydroxysteroid dehydrogenase 14-like n=1 Tax=Anneissia japonica TaxID=1529436 RepID=UPI0014255E26|nr:17-beta-hydroxysteroid dehydrogenase 14-like [Anneissia japonica]
MASSLRYLNKVALVTGGSKGIGEGVVRVFVQNGAKVGFCSIEEEAGKKLESEVNRLGPGESIFIKCDVQNEDEIKYRSTIDRFGQLDCLVNNAGWHPPQQVIDDTSVEEFKSLINLNLINYFAFAKYSLPHLRKTNGNIINVSSLVATVGQSYAIPYVCTKGAIVAFSKALAIDEAKHGVRVNTFSPGNIWTPLWEWCAKQSDNPEAMIQGGANAQLNGRFGTIEECGQVCLFLASEATFTTGIELISSGGAELNFGCKNQMMERTNIYE